MIEHVDALPRSEDADILSDDLITPDFLRTFGFRV